MASTSIVKLYRLNKGYNFSQVEKRIIEKFGYSQFTLREEIQTANNLRIKAFQRANTDDPDWVKLIQPYLINPNYFSDKKIYSSLLFLFHKSVNENKEIIEESDEDCYLITGGSGAHNILSELDYQFGIEILERIFNPDENKLDSVKEKAVIGDVLASNRFYRRARSLAFEDEFGKFFQDISLKVSKSQVEEYFPSIAEYKGTALKDILSISCCDNIEIKAKIDFITLVKLIKDINYILSIETEHIFNQSLVPLTKRKEKKIINNLNWKLRNSFVYAIEHNDYDSIDFDICAKNYEDFYSSTHYEVYLGDLHFLTPANKKIPPISGDDVHEFNQFSLLKRISEFYIESKEYHQATSKSLFLKEKLPTLRISTFKEDGNISTTGSILSYIQTELTGKKSFFYIDGVWYFLKEKFDESILEKFQSHIVPKLKNYGFIESWDVENETQYNEKYDKKTNPLYLHTVNIRNVELCDALYTFDDRIYIIHVKNGIGATIRDLVSQVFISARILEEELRTGNHEYIQELYQQGVSRERIDSGKMTFDDFLYNLQLKREYCLVIYDETISKQKFISADFGSRIAKFSLIEFAGMMHANNWDISIVKI